MKTYCSTDVVEALEVNYLLGDVVSDKKKPGKKSTVVLPNDFVTRNVIRLGDYITFKNGVPVDVMSPAVFNESYEEHRIISDQQAEEDLNA